MTNFEKAKIRSLLEKRDAAAAAMRTAANRLSALQAEVAEWTRTHDRAVRAHLDAEEALLEALADEPTPTEECEVNS